MLKTFHPYHGLSRQLHFLLRIAWIRLAQLDQVFQIATFCTQSQEEIGRKSRSVYVINIALPQFHDQLRES